MKFRHFPKSFFFLCGHSGPLIGENAVGMIRAFLLDTFLGFPVEYVVDGLEINIGEIR